MHSPADLGTDSLQARGVIASRNGSEAPLVAAGEPSTARRGRGEGTPRIVTCSRGLFSLRV